MFEVDHRGFVGVLMRVCNVCAFVRESFFDVCDIYSLQLSDFQ